MGQCNPEHLTDHSLERRGALAWNGALGNIRESTEKQRDLGRGRMCPEPKLMRQEVNLKYRTFRRISRESSLCPRQGSSFPPLPSHRHRWKAASVCNTQLWSGKSDEVEMLSGKLPQSPCVKNRLVERLGLATESSVPKGGRSGRQKAGEDPSLERKVCCESIYFGV